MVNEMECFVPLLRRRVRQLRVSRQPSQNLNRQPIAQFRRLQAHGIDPDEFSISKALASASCLAAMDEGKQLHALILKKNLPMDVAATNTLINFYFKCGSISDAQRVFDDMPSRDVYSWTVMVSGYALAGNLSDAIKLFQSMPSRNTVSWNAMITACQREGSYAIAIQLYARMRREGVASNNLTLIAVLKAYTALRLLEEGKGVHCSGVKGAWIEDVLVGSTLVDMYAKCGCMLNAQKAFGEVSGHNVISWSILLAGFARNGMIVEAERVFCEMPEKNVVSWNVFIVGLVQNGSQNRAIGVFLDMLSSGVLPNSCTITSLLSGCSSSRYLNEGKTLHNYALKIDLLSEISVCNSLITMYGEQGNASNARRIFDRMNSYDVISWTAMLAVYVANKVVEEARSMFDRMPEKNLIAWNTMMFGYLQNGKILETKSQNNNGNLTCFLDDALIFFCELVRSEVSPDHFSYNCAITACGLSGAMGQVAAVHCHALKFGFESEIGVGNALISAYGKCGSLLEAERSFKSLSAPDMISWNALLTAYSQNGQGNEALVLFDEMRRSGVELNNVTFISLLSACCYTGEIKKGQFYFEIMEKLYGIHPTREHYACIVDLLGRAGLLCEAEAIIKQMPIDPDSTVWGALLGACKMHGDPLIAKRAAEQMLILEPENAAAHVAISKTFADMSMWTDVETVWASMKKKRLAKEPGCSWINIKNEKHIFLSNDCRHQQKDLIDETLWTIYRNIFECSTTDLEIIGLHDSAQICTHYACKLMKDGSVNQESTCW